MGDPALPLSPSTSHFVVERIERFQGPTTGHGGRGGAGVCEKVLIKKDMVGSSLQPLSSTGK